MRLFTSVLLLSTFGCFSQSLAFNPNELIEYASRQYSKLSQLVKPGLYPVSGKPKSFNWDMSSDGGWTSGFYAGILWQLYNYTGDSKWKALAENATEGLARIQYVTTTHDVGFMIMSSYGQGLAISNNPDYVQVIKNAAASLATRFNPIVGCTRSWNKPDMNQFWVIVDNMMNLGLLLKSWQISNNKTYLNMALSHTNRTIEEHMRPDGSSFHVVIYNAATGQVIDKRTAGGYASWSTWSQGHAWLINGLAMVYRYTRRPHILEAAKRASDYYIKHLPDDFVPYWDFNITKGVYNYIPRDTSAAAVAAGGFFELYHFTGNKTYLKTATKTMESLNSSKYRLDGKRSYHLPGILANGTADFKTNNYDTALIFGDFYFIEAVKHIPK